MAETRFPAARGTVAVNVFGLAVSVAWTNAGDNAVFDESAKQTVVSVVRSTEKVEIVVVAKLVVVDFLPVPVGIVLERILYFLRELKICQQGVRKSCRK